MTFQEYLNQKEIKRSHGVVVKKSDCEYITKAIGYGLDKYIRLKILDTYYDYVTKIGSDLLYSIDSDGNPKSSSCFVLSE